MHYDYSPGLGAIPAMPSPEAAAFVPFIPQMQEGSTKKYTAYQIYNLIRFNDPDIGGPKAGVSGFPRLTQRMKANTPPLGYEIVFFGVREAFKKAFMPKKFKNADLNSRLYKAFKSALAVVQLSMGAKPSPPSPPGVDEENIDEQAGTQAAPPAAFPVVPVAIAAVGLVAVLLMRKK